MLYQKLLLGNQPYLISVGTASVFEIHRHPEIELSYCLEGSYDIICENKRYTLSAGDLAVIAPMAAHEIPDNNDTSCRSMTIELGYPLLGEYFEAFTRLDAHCRFCRKTDLFHVPSYQQLVSAIVETAVLYRSDLPFRALSVKGNLYKISALLLQTLNSPQAENTQSRKRNDIEKIDKALETIYNRYYEPLNIKAVSTACGYSESNFCKVFKHITGETFHNTLNRHRIEIACILLRESSDPIEKIALETGFTDLKSFCRVFKNHTGSSAGEYRKQVKAK